ncbi:phosphate propanoyltransferase [Streptococcus parasanguinis]|jgi:propanediol utilization protein|uniref:phosphate propanoyltransferase n=1 Tax=Streptococcus parasanguinis TaxID=1318 RepID=UPI001D0701D6|nr:phosphate propanoyltransferase [Streptococcus parasanguinis]MCB6703490.1 phosphate propanoyltransferase [Streptococcus parasanguinis]MCB6737860.1 phosphate propanoyltransferase [Streptococcus parasanguinis]MCB7322166.1 phosphate propanoyltransferase [Streptococcus parasanguinis]MCB7401803.1 phosphate propanoyltransferase [Streptococcus parasanguinis]
MSEDLESLFYLAVEHLGGEKSLSDTAVSKQSDDVSEIPAQQVETVIDLCEKQVENVTKKCDPKFNIPLGVSNHHVHLSQADADVLFGKNYTFSELKPLSQKGQFAYKECITLAGPKGVVERVRVLGPVRKQTQVELTTTDCFKLGLKAPIRLSGDLADTPGCTLIGPAGSVQLKSGCIVAKRHIHMDHFDAIRFGVRNDQVVSLEVPGERGGIINNVSIRVDESFTLECHLDTEEANALGVCGNNRLKMIK